MICHSTNIIRAAGGSHGPSFPFPALAGAYPTWARRQWQHQCRVRLLSNASEYKKTAGGNHRRFVLALPIFPCSHPQSIVGANELNFCVRDGNRWTLIAINTNYMDKSFRFHRLVRPVARPVCQSAMRSNSSSILARYSRSVKHFSHP